MTIQDALLLSACIIAAPDYLWPMAAILWGAEEEDE